MKRNVVIAGLAGLAWLAGCATGTKTAHAHSGSAPSDGIDPVTLAGIEESNRRTQEDADASARAANEAATQASVNAANAAAAQAAADAAQAATNAANAQ